MIDAEHRVNQTEAAKRPRWLMHLAIGITILVTCALIVDSDSVGSLEEDIFRAINGLPGALEPILWLVMQYGNVGAIPVAFVVALIFRHWPLSLSFAIGGAAKYLFAWLIKEIVVRYRPAQMLAEVQLRDAPTEGQAFVSGHATIAILLATLMHPYTTATWQRVVIWALAVLTCFGRVYSGAHLPLDVVGGAGLGVAIGAVIHLIIGTPDAPPPGEAD